MTRLAAALTCILALSALSAYTLTDGQVVKPASILEELGALNRHNYDHRAVKAAVLSNWPSLRSPRSSSEHVNSPERRDVSTSIGEANDTAVSIVGTIFERLYAAGPSVDCSWDETLLFNFKQVSSKKVMLAANFKDNEDLFPHIIRETWRFVSLLPTHNIFISVYESGSNNSKTAMWLEVYSRILEASGVQHRIITSGALVKGENDSRIDFLAKVRNKAMEPLWLLANKSLSDASDQASRQKPWKADRVLFMNDVFICAKDFMRLLLHDVDMACALDFGDRDKEGEGVVWGQDLQEERKFELLPHLSSNRRLKDMHIYDKWVVRDTDGHLVESKPPYTMQSSYTKERLLAGLPFPVTSCWNGLVVLPAKPFLDGLRFRDHAEGECRASECSLLCHDLRRLNYTRIVADPGVQLAYEIYDAAGLYIKDVVGDIQRTTWDDIRRSPAIDQSYFNRDSEMCCNLDELNWSDNPLKCTWSNFLDPNYTRIAFPHL